jgi:short-subunit dehydrogenase
MGIGAVFAKRLAADGCHVVLVARSKQKLEALAGTLRSAHGVKAEAIVADLTKPGAAAAVLEATRARGLEIDLLINNAGFATHGAFEQTPITRLVEEVTLNVTALMELTHAFLPQLLERRGAIINVASTAAFQPIPQMAVYGATKAFVLSFSEALWAEYQSRGVRVLALCPGATETPFFEVAGEAAALGKKAAPEAVVELGLAALAKGRTHVIHGFGNYVLANLNRFVPREFTVKLTRSVMEKNAQPKKLTASTAR